MSSLTLGLLPVPPPPEQSPYNPQSSPQYQRLRPRSSAPSTKVPPPRLALVSRSSQKPKPQQASFNWPVPHKRSPAPQNDRRGRGPSAPASPPPPLARILSALGEQLGAGHPNPVPARSWGEPDLLCLPISSPRRSPLRRRSSCRQYVGGDGGRERTNSRSPVPGYQPRAPASPPNLHTRRARSWERAS